MRLTKVMNASYWERVSMMAETQDQAEISYIMENECEDDFKIALAQRSDATAEQLAWCADTSSIKAQNIILAHENASNETIVLIATNSVDTYKENIGHASYVHPMQGYHKKMVELSRETFKVATIVAQHRGASWLTAGDAMAMLTDDYHLNARAEQTAMDTVRDYIDNIIDHKTTMAGECLDAYSKTALGITMPIRKFW